MSISSAARQLSVLELSAMSHVQLLDHRNGVDGHFQPQLIVVFRGCLWWSLARMANVLWFRACLDQSLGPGCLTPFLLWRFRPCERHQLFLASGWVPKRTGESSTPSPTGLSNVGSGCSLARPSRPHRNPSVPREVSDATACWADSSSAEWLVFQTQSLPLSFCLPLVALLNDPEGH
jgi:hypothetical protein